MPFKPLPEKFHELIAHLQTIQGPSIVDLGSGEGAFGRLFQQAGLQIFDLDRSSMSTGVSQAVRGDALEPPFKQGSLDCLIAGNLLRHLLVQNGGDGFLLRWIRLLKPGGTLFLFEDEPDSTSANSRNFRDLQSFLAELMPGQRGPLLGLDFFLELAEKQIPAQFWQRGFEHNFNEPNVEAVQQMLTSGGTNPNPGGMAGKLLESIHAHGLSYGSFWWASTHVD